MLVVEYGPGDIAWLEPETEEDRKLIEKAKEENWPIGKILEAIAHPSEA